MCIRDRHLVELLGVQPAWDVVWFASHGDAEGVMLSDGLCPVSYTHLRAHETVLDLVCRLLLEKKKDSELKLTLRHTYIQ